MYSTSTVHRRVCTAAPMPWHCWQALRRVARLHTQPWHHSRHQRSARRHARGRAAAIPSTSPVEYEATPVCATVSLPTNETIGAHWCGCCSLLSAMGANLRWRKVRYTLFATWPTFDAVARAYECIWTPDLQLATRRDPSSQPRQRRRMARPRAARRRSLEFGYAARIQTL